MTVSSTITIGGQLVVWHRNKLIRFSVDMDCSIVPIKVILVLGG